MTCSFIATTSVSEENKHKKLAKNLVKNSTPFSFVPITVAFDLTGQKCVQIYKPTNGKKYCLGYRTEDSCYFDCLPGYDLTGSKTRTCGPDKKWTGNDTKCNSELYLKLKYNNGYTANSK